ncbi:MAG: hypothetical protein PHE93_06550 [Clostridia bacterium]|nr:hypothetical protein [Clostridia bacterium]
MSISVAKIYGFSVYTINELRKIYGEIISVLSFETWLLANFCEIEGRYMHTSDYEMLEQYLELENNEIA